jgi:hypothetical protein
MRVEYTIDELVLIGFEPGARDLIAAEVERELAARAISGPRRSRPAPGRDRDLQPITIGAQIARDVVSAVNR